MYARGELCYVSAMRNAMGFTKFKAINTAHCLRAGITRGLNRAVPRVIRTRRAGSTLLHSFLAPFRADGWGHA